MTAHCNKGRAVMLGDLIRVVPLGGHWASAALGPLAGVFMGTNACGDVIFLQLGSISNRIHVSRHVIREIIVESSFEDSCG